MITIASICAVVAVVFLASTTVAHGCSYYDTYCSQTPLYSYTGTYQYPYVQPNISPLIATCYATPLSVYIGGTAQWGSSVSGGAGTYNITWIGDEGLSGYGSTLTKTYYSPGQKSASITVVSGGQSVSVNCSDTVTVSGTAAAGYGYNYSNYNNYNTNNGYSNYPSNIYSSNSYTNYASPFTASCSANTTFGGIGSSVTWTAQVTGGNGYYTYSWYGTDGLFGGNQSTTFIYNTPGSKTGYVTVYSNGQTTTAYCTNSVNIGTNFATTYPTGYTNTANTLDIGCYADPANVTVNQPVTWNVEVTGGAAPYTYSWTGSDGLTGSQSTAIKYYSTTGSKNAIVSVTSADGKTGTHACSNAVTVRAAGSTYVRPANTTNTTNTTNGTNNTVQPAQTNGQAGSQLTSSAVFSFDNVPWGWIAILIILVLFGTVMYLLFNRQKI